MDEKNSKKSGSWSWKLDEANLKNQLDNYNTLGITQSYRGISVLIVAALLGISLILSFFGLFADPTTMFWEILIYLPILYFVYNGHRWAIILLMVLYSFERGAQVYEISQSGSNSIALPIIWWCIVMPYFWKALRIENERKKVAKLHVVHSDNRFCKHCGSKVELDSKFCANCGGDINS